MDSSRKRVKELEPELTKLYKADFIELLEDVFNSHAIVKEMLSTHNYISMDRLVRKQFFLSLQNLEKQFVTLTPPYDDAIDAILIVRWEIQDAEWSIGAFTARNESANWYILFLQNLLTHNVPKIDIFNLLNFRGRSSDYSFCMAVAKFETGKMMQQLINLFVSLNDRSQAIKILVEEKYGGNIPPSNFITLAYEKQDAETLLALIESNILPAAVLGATKKMKEKIFNHILTLTITEQRHLFIEARTKGTLLNEFFDAKRGLFSSDSLLKKIETKLTALENDEQGIKGEKSSFLNFHLSNSKKKARGPDEWPMQEIKRRPENGEGKDGIRYGRGRSDFD